MTHFTKYFCLSSINENRKWSDFSQRYRFEKEEIAQLFLNTPYFVISLYCDGFNHFMKVIVDIEKGLTFISELVINLLFQCLRVCGIERNMSFLRICAVERNVFDKLN